MLRSCGYTASVIPLIRTEYKQIQIYSKSENHPNCMKMGNFFLITNRWIKIGNNINYSNEKQIAVDDLKISHVRDIIHENKKFHPTFSTKKHEAPSSRRKVLFQLLTPKHLS